MDAEEFRERRAEARRSRRILASVLTLAENKEHYQNEIKRLDDALEEAQGAGLIERKV